MPLTPEDQDGTRWITTGDSSHQHRVTEAVDGTIHVDWWALPAAIGLGLLGLVAIALAVFVMHGRVAHDDEMEGRPWPDALVLLAALAAVALGSLIPAGRTIASLGSDGDTVQPSAAPDLWAPGINVVGNDKTPTDRGRGGLWRLPNGVSY